MRHAGLPLLLVLVLGACSAPTVPQAQPPASIGKDNIEALATPAQLEDCRPRGPIRPCKVVGGGQVRVTALAAAGTPVSFTPSPLVGVTPSYPTSLQFGPDGRLYVATQFGTIYAYTVKRNASNNYAVTAFETINLVR